jgi:hypothetical protein
MQCHVALWHNGQSHQGVFELSNGTAEGSTFCLSSPATLGAVNLKVMNVRKTRHQSAMKFDFEAIVEDIGWTLGMGWQSVEDFLFSIGFTTRTSSPAWYTWR